VSESQIYENKCIECGKTLQVKVAVCGILGESLWVCVYVYEMFPGCVLLWYSLCSGPLVSLTAAY